MKFNFYSIGIPESTFSSYPKGKTFAELFTETRALHRKIKKAQNLANDQSRYMRLCNFTEYAARDLINSKSGQNYCGLLKITSDKYDVESIIFSQNFANKVIAKLLVDSKLLEENLNKHEVKFVHDMMSSTSGQDSFIRNFYAPRQEVYNAFNVISVASKLYLSSRGRKITNQPDYILMNLFKHSLEKAYKNRVGVIFLLDYDF